MDSTADVCHLKLQEDMNAIINKYFNTEPVPVAEALKTTVPRPTEKVFNNIID